MKLLFLICALAAHLPAADEAAVEQRLVALRVTDTASVLQTLKDIRAMPGFPRSAEPLLPALVWLADSDSLDLAIEAKSLAAAIGWPKLYCLPCLRKFAARQDESYRMMGLSALAKLVWDDPEAMWTLMDICERAKPTSFRLAFRVSQSLSKRSCPDRLQMDAYNERARTFMGRFHTSISRATYKSRYLLQALGQCPDLLPELKNSAKAAYDRLPPNSNANAVQ